MRRTGIIIFIVILLSGFIFLFDKHQGEKEVQEELFTEADLIILEPFENQTITMGYFKGQETNFRNSFKDVMQNELGINVEIVQYSSYTELEAAALRGEVDFFINMSNGEAREELHWISFPLINTSFVVTNRQNPLGNINELNYNKVGFLTDSLLYEEYQGVVGEAYFFNSVEAVLDALERQEINAFMTRIAWVVEEIIPRKELQIEFTFQHNIVNFEIVTAKDELYPIIEVFGEIANSPRANLFRKKLDQSRSQTMGRKIRDYIHETYASVIKAFDTIEVGHHEMNFPYSYFNRDGVSSGIYIELLDLFQSKTDIQYKIRNELGGTNYSELFNKLKNNDIQFLLGVGNVHRVDEIVTIGSNVQDSLISIATFENRMVETRALSEIKFGIVTSPEVADQILGQTNFTVFEDYDSAIEALRTGDIDVLNGRHSMLMYYKNVLGYSFLTQVNIITGNTEHSILGNANNEDLNALMEDLRRIHQLINTEDSEVIGHNQSINYQVRYLELRDFQERLNNLILSFVAAIVMFVIYKTYRENKVLKVKNERDKLTGLYNGDTYEKKCNELIDKNPDKLGVFLFLDVDDLKLCNDTYGHAMGDKLIMEFAKTLERLEDENTICFRIAGDEFGIFRMGFQTRIEIEEMITEIKNDLKCQLNISNEITIPIKISAGGSIYNINSTNFSNLKQYADLAMYQAKREKKKKEQKEAVTIKLFDIESVRMQSNNLIDTILKEKQIFSVFQSIHSLESGEVCGHESLTRTTNQNISNITALIELAEAEGKLYELDLLMMETSIRSFRGSGALFINMEYKTPEFVREYIEKMIGRCKENGISSERLVVEISERRQWSLESLKVINQLKEKYRFRTAIDDFGVGFANSALLLYLKPNIVKIDRSLLCNLDEDEEKYEYLMSLVEFIKKQKVKIIFEGIEREEELNAIKMISHDYGQGYYFEIPKRHDE